MTTCSELGMFRCNHDGTEVAADYFITEVKRELWSKSYACCKDCLSKAVDSFMDADGVTTDIRIKKV